jgi:hypothetical protein
VALKCLHAMVVIMTVFCLMGVQSFGACATCEEGCCNVLGKVHSSIAASDKGCFHHNKGCCSKKIASCRKKGGCTCGSLIPAAVSNHEREDRPAIDLGIKASKSIFSAPRSREIPVKFIPVTIAFPRIYLRTLSILI